MVAFVRLCFARDCDSLDSPFAMAPPSLASKHIRTLSVLLNAFLTLLLMVAFVKLRFARDCDSLDSPFAIVLYLAILIYSC